MVRTFILTEEQRQGAKNYLENRPPLMSQQVRGLRMRVKMLNFEQMESDIALLRRLKALKIPKGRRSKDIAAEFVVAAKKEGDVPAQFEAKTPEEKK